MRSHFELNSLVNTIVNNLPISEDDVSTLMQVIKRQRDLIHDEFDELSTGIKERNISEVRDGIADVIVTVDGMYFRVGLEYPRVELWSNRDLSIDEHVRSIEVSLKLMEEMVAAGLDGNTVGYFKHRVKVYCDSILYSCYRLSQEYGIDLLADQEAVFASNMTKFDTDIEVARRGVAKYAEMGVKTDVFPNKIDGLTYHVIKCTEDSVDAAGKKYNAGKFLKSVFFKEPELQPLAANAPIFELFGT